MRSTVDTLSRDLMDLSVPIRSREAIQDARLVAADTVMCALLADGPAATGRRDSTGVRQWAGPATGSARTVELNAASAHLLELDPVHYVTRGHPGVVVVPALSALVDLEMLTPREALDTLVLATEIMAFLGQAWGPGLSAAAVHATSFLGPVAAVAAVARVRGCSPTVVDSSMFAAVALGAGATASFGTSLKARQVGRAAQLIVDLAATPPPDDLGSRWQDELVRRFGEPQEEWITDGDAPRLGHEIVVEQVPSMFKLLPACAFFAAPIQQVLRVVEQHRPADVVDLTIDVPHEAFEVNRGGLPTHPNQVPFSLEYLISCLLVAGRLGDFRTDRWLSDPAVADLVGRVRVRPIPGEFEFVDTLLDGQLRIDSPTTSVVQPLTYDARPPRSTPDDLRRKWTGLARDVGTDAAADLEALLTDLERAERTDAGWFPTYYERHSR